MAGSVPAGPRTISILVHESDPQPRRTRHCIWRIADVWQEQGHRVEVLRGLRRRLGRDEAQEIDLLVPQVDLTRTPRRYVEYMDLFPRVLNRRVIDISKRLVSRNLLRRDSSWDGPVIVKTDRNYGGLREARGVPWSFGALLSRIQRKRRAVARGDFRWIQEIPTEAYPIFEGLEQVPPSVWSNRHLVVERFIPERIDGYYCIRVCLLLGDVVLNRRLYSTRPVIKGGTERSEELAVPEALHAFRERLGLDYGKVEYVVHDGELHVLDANRSPGILADDEVTDRICRKLAVGLDAVLAGSGRERGLEGRG